MTSANSAPSAPISALLLDADGVVQFTEDVRGRLAEVLGSPETVSELWALEKQALDGAHDFTPMLTEFLASKGRPDAAPEVLEVWHNIEPYPGALDLLAELRAAGLPLYLGTNQQNVRGAYMVANLDYDQHFDKQFYSFELGVAKPNPAFFTAVVQQLGVDPASVLFIDDMHDNVAGALAAGLQAEWHDRESEMAGLRAILVRHGLLPR